MRKEKGSCLVHAGVSIEQGGERTGCKRMIKYVFFSVWVGRSNASQCIAHDEEDGRANRMQVQYRAHEYRRMNAKLAIYQLCGH